MNKKTVRDVDFRGRRVLVRVDFNVPLEGDTITDDTRIRAAIPTLRYILEQQPRSVLLLSHLSRPKAKGEPGTSLAPVAPALAHLLGHEVKFVDDTVGEAVKAAAEALPQGGLLLLENTRYYKGEEKNDPALAAQMASLGDVFVNDAFGTAHRAHASNVGISSHLEAVAGLLMEKEIDYLATALEQPAHPFVAIMGGAKVSDKILVIESLLGKVDHLFIGGGMANTFFAAQGHDMGDSLVEKEALDIARELLGKGGDKLVLPIDAVIADALSNEAQHRVVAVGEGVPAGWRVLDIGPRTLDHFASLLRQASTIVWNGPMGVFEMPTFARGTFGIAEVLADVTASGATTIIGGGDSAAAAEQSGLAERMTHISTGGGASLEMLEGKALPGVTALADR